MTADELRQASGEMRRLAEAATPGPWVVITDHHRALGVREVSVWSESDKRYVTEDVFTAGNSPFLANANHVASWNPGVAMAVAAWLDSVVERGEAEMEEGQQAAAVARAYLGGES